MEKLGVDFIGSLFLLKSVWIVRRNVCSLLEENYY